MGIPLPIETVRLLVRVFELSDAENEASLRGPERLGMSRAGELEPRGRPHVLFEARPG